MKAQWLALWSDLKWWIGQHIAISCLSATIVLLIFIAAVR